MGKTTELLKRNKYSFLFVLVTLINIGLISVLIMKSFGQARLDNSVSKQPIRVSILPQKECPLDLTILGLDNSDPSFQTVEYSVQNVGQKAIRSYVLLGSARQSTRVLVHSFDTELFSPSSGRGNKLPFENGSLSERDSVVFSVDYVEFRDGSHWGDDSQGKSIELAGQHAGVRDAVKYFKMLVRDLPDSGTIFDVRAQDIQELKVDMPDMKQPDEWKTGYRIGYKTVISVLNKVNGRQNKDFGDKLREFEKIAFDPVIK